MKKVHVVPLTPKSVFEKYLKDECILVSYFRGDAVTDLKRAGEIGCKEIFIDNGAYSFYRKEIKPDYSKFYKWLKNKNFTYFFIPDVINGTEEENDKLINEVPEEFIKKAIPVFHISESNERLERLMKEFNYIAFAATGEFWTVGSKIWFKRMHELMKIVCDESGKPKIKIHALRCLNYKVFIHFPFESADSSNLSRNHHKKGAGNLLKRINSFDAPKFYQMNKIQSTIFDLIA